ncbi:hypothetical protein PRUPE_1G487000 [Prunus persica]|uniref:Uncharacterized protein n=1 Tax=Prunus persica TaxID=3760 RepID=A0A251RFG5_PRUPE|nr:hypothetical protein PRUPE_1G487000 [Prunus persica]
MPFLIVLGQILIHDHRKDLFGIYTILLIFDCKIKHTISPMIWYQSCWDLMNEGEEGEEGEKRTQIGQWNQTSSFSLTSSLLETQMQSLASSSLPSLALG